MIKPAIKTESIKPSVVYNFVENEIYRAQIFEEEKKHIEFMDKLIPAIRFMSNNGITPEHAESYFNRLSHSFKIVNISPINSNEESFANIRGNISVHKRNSNLIRINERYYDVNNPGIFISKRFSCGKEDKSFVGFLSEASTVSSVILIVDDNMNLTGDICFEFEIANIDEYINKNHSFIKNSIIFPVSTVSFSEEKGDITIINKRVFDVPEGEKMLFKPVCYTVDSIKGMNAVNQVNDIVDVLEKVDFKPFIESNFK